MENITVLCANPCVDWQYNVNSFHHGGLNRVQVKSVAAAGKGLNVCATLKQLGCNPLYTGFGFCENFNGILECLAANGIEHDLVQAQGRVRTNIKVFEEDTGVMTELNQAGPVVTSAEVAALEEKIATLSKSRGGILVLTGSLPGGVPPNFYATLAKSWRGKVFLDAEHDALRTALDTKAIYAIKPNLYEVESAFGIKLSSPDEICGFLRGLFADGKFGRLELACVSLGKDGAVLGDRSGCFFCPPIDVGKQSAQGAGDAMVAAMVRLVSAGERTPETTLRYAIAAAAAAMSSRVPGASFGGCFDEMLSRVSGPSVVAKFCL